MRFRWCERWIGFMCIFPLLLFRFLLHKMSISFLLKFKLTFVYDSNSHLFTIFNNNKKTEKKLWKKSVILRWFSMLHDHISKVLFQMAENVCSMFKTLMVQRKEKIKRVTWSPAWSKKCIVMLILVICNMQTEIEWSDDTYRSVW